MKTADILAIGIAAILRNRLRTAFYLLTNLLLFATLAGFYFFGFALENREGRLLRAAVGGDVAIRLENRDFNPDEIAFVVNRADRLTRLSEFQSMASNSDKAAPIAKLAQIRAVDQNYPLRGSVATTPRVPLDLLLAVQNGRFGAIASPELVQFLNLALGDPLTIDGLVYEFRGIIDALPDQIGNLGRDLPIVLVPIGSLTAANLAENTALYQNIIQLELRPANSITDFTGELDRAFSAGQWQVSTTADKLGAAGELQVRVAPFLFIASVLIITVYAISITAIAIVELDRLRPSDILLTELGATVSERNLIPLARWGVYILGTIIIGTAAILAITVLTRPPSTNFATILFNPTLFNNIGRVVMAYTSLSTALAWYSWFRHYRPNIRRLVIGTIFLSFLLLINLVIFSGSFQRPYLALVAIIAMIGLFGLGLTFLKGQIRKRLHGISRVAIGLRLFAQPHARLEYLGMVIFAALIITYIFSNFQRQLVSDRALLTQLAPVNHDISQLLPEQRQNFEAAIAKTPVTIRAIYPTAQLRLIVDPPGQQRRYLGPFRVVFLEKQPQEVRLIAGNWWRTNADSRLQVSLSDEIARASGLDIGDQLTISTIAGEKPATITATHRDPAVLGMFAMPVLADGAAFQQYSYSYLADLSVPQEFQPQFFTLINDKFSNLVIRSANVARTHAQTRIEQLLRINALIVLNLIIAVAVAFYVISGLQKRSQRDEFALLDDLGAGYPTQLWLRMATITILTGLALAAVILVDRLIAPRLITELFGGAAVLEHRRSLAAAASVALLLLAIFLGRSLRRMALRNFAKS